MWDVLAARDGTVIAFELKGPGDRVKPSQIDWYRSALSQGLDASLSAVVMWDVH